MQTSRGLVVPHPVSTGVAPDKSFQLLGRNISDSTQPWPQSHPSQPSLGLSTLSFPVPVLAVEGIPRTQSLKKPPFATVNSKPLAFTSSLPSVTLSSQTQPFTVPPPSTLTSQSQPFTVPPPATVTSQSQPFTVPPPATVTSQPSLANLTSKPLSFTETPLASLTWQPQSFTAPPPVKETSKPDSYSKTVSRSSKYKPWKVQTRCLRYLEPGIPQDENIGSVQSVSNLSSNSTQASNLISCSTPGSNLQSYSTPVSNLPTFSTQASNLLLYSTPDSNLTPNSIQSSNLSNNSTLSSNMPFYPSSGSKLPTYSTQVSNLPNCSTPGSILPNHSTQSSNLPNFSTTASGKPTYANFFSFSKSIKLPPLTMSTETTPRYKSSPGKPNTSQLPPGQTVESSQTPYLTPGSTVPSFFNSATLPKPGGPTQKLFTNSLPQHAYTILQNIFGTDPSFSAKYASLQDLYEFFSKKFSVMENFGYDGCYIEVISFQILILFGFSFLRLFRSTSLKFDSLRIN